MTWTAIARRKHNRHKHNCDTLRFPSDLPDRAWALIAPLIPPTKCGGRPRTTDKRDVVEAILFIASGGCQWRMLAGDFPPFSTVRGYFFAWRDAGLFESINHILVMTAREIKGREASPSTGIIDSQSVKTCDTGGIRGNDARKKVKGRKRHIVTETLGFLLFVLVHGADV